jgi:hypothetical protein
MINYDSDADIFSNTVLDAKSGRGRITLPSGKVLETYLSSLESLQGKMQWASTVRDYAKAELEEKIPSERSRATNTGVGPPASDDSGTVDSARPLPSKPVGTGGRSSSSSQSPEEVVRQGLTKALEDFEKAGHEFYAAREKFDAAQDAKDKWVSLCDTLGIDIDG